MADRLPSAATGRPLIALLILGGKQMRAQVWYGMKVLTSSHLLSSMDSLGVPRPDMEKLCGAPLWLAADRHIIRRALDALLYGALDAIGIQRFMLSAEYIAAFIALVVHPSNHLVACAWYHGSVSADALLSDPEHVPIAEGLTAHQLMALVVEAIACRDLGESVSDFQHRLQQAMIAGETTLQQIDQQTTGGQNASTN